MNPAAAAGNARTAVRDDGAVAYIGELDEGSPHSIPFTNEGGVAQVGIADTSVGLTTDEDGANPAEPVVYHAVGEAYVRAHRAPGHDSGRRAHVDRDSERCTSLAIANDGTRLGAA